MAPNQWDDEDSSTPPSSPPAIAKRSKFEDEEDDSDVVDDWEAEDSEVEREKAKKAAEVKAKADAEAAANKKSKAQRIEERRMENMRKRIEEEEEESSEEEDEATKRARLRQTEQDADLKHAQDLFEGIGVNKRSTTKAVVTADPSDPTKAIDLAALPLFKPTSKEQFSELRDTLAPIFQSNSKKPHYVLFMQEFIKLALRDLPSDQIKKIASGITTLSNERMKEEKAAEKGAKKTKAAKTKSTLNAARDTSVRADINAYDDLGDDDFM